MNLSEREWLVLSALWDSGGTSLGPLTEALYPRTGWSRNTVMTYLTRMESKGLVSIDRESRPSLYRAALNKGDCQARERKSFLQRVYHGSAGDLVAAFLREEPITPEEREALRRLLDEMEV